MASNNPLERMISISIGKIGIRILLTDPGLAARLAEMYQDHPAGPLVQLTVTIGVAEPGIENVRKSPDLVIDGAVVIFFSHLYQGEIDLEHGIGNVIIFSASPIEAIDYLLRLLIAILGFWAGGLLIHAAGIVHRGKAHVFFGHSGSGKSTIARISKPDVALNDDLVLVMPGEKGWIVYSTPFWNPTQVRPTAANAPLGALYLLQKDVVSYLEEMPPSQAVAEMISCIPVIAGITGWLNELIGRCSDLLGSVPVYRLHFTQHASFWEIIDQAELGD